MNREMSIKDRIRQQARIFMSLEGETFNVLMDALYEIKALESRVRGGNDYHTPECLTGESEGLEHINSGDRHDC